MRILKNKLFGIFCCVCIFVFSAHHAHAATLKVSPNTGVYTVGASFTASVLLNTEGKAVNASDGQLSFNPRELQVVGVSRASSIFNLWTEEPSFSNSAGTISFGGGSPTGYKGTSGSILSITFKPLGAGTPKVTFKSGSALAADGMGTNVLTAMSGATYTIAAKTDAPAPEYIPPANTPQAPKVTSTTHADESVWYKEKTAELSWSLPDDVIAVRMLLDENSGTVPTKVYDERLAKKTLEDLPEGISYFHIQFKNKDGWGRIAHFKISVDSEAPKDFSITEEKSDDVNNPAKVLLFTSTDVSPINIYKIQIDGKDAFEYKDEKLTKKYTLESLAPGYHTLTVEAFDSAGNTAIASYSLTINSFEKPLFTEYPTRINTEVIPAIKGTTRPNATVSITLTKSENSESGQDYKNDSYTVESDANGGFVFIPNKPLESGVYSITAVATDAFGSMSDRSDEIKIIVEKPGYVVIGAVLVSVLSIVVPIVALILVLIFGTWYLWHKLSVWRRKVLKETKEAESELVTEFDILVKNLNERILELKESRKNKLTKAETALIEQIEADIATARTKIAKEIDDIEKSIS